ncbi:MAG: hypothetical protein FGM24_04620 [Candidatus Kapabacteria bacterium]|nr:hypothetical protein [Candidatus Kapabacteria bacterium]
MKQANTLVAVLMLLGVMPAAAQTFYNDPFFAISTNDRRCLRYAVVRNVFDSAYVQFTIGELRVQTDNVERRVPFELEEVGGQTMVQGNAMQGRDTSLAALLQSAPFDVPQQGGSIEFFRMVRVQRGCIERGSSDEPQQGDDPKNAVDWNFCPGLNVLHDTTAVTIELVRVDDGAVVATLDSVVVRSTANSRFASLTGSAPTTVNRRIPIPVQAFGQRVIVRIVPYRYGPTPFGCTAHREDVWVAKSAHLTYEPGQAPIMDQQDSRWARLDSLYWQQLLSFYDGVLDQYGCVQSVMIPTYFPSARHRGDFLQRYFDVAQHAADDTSVTYVRSRPCLAASAMPADTGAPATTDVAVISSSWSQHADVALSIRSYQPIPKAAIDLVSAASGQVVGSWNIDVHAGHTALTLNAPWLASGTYIAILRRGDVPISTTRLAVLH